jgi:DNA polymerase elongation subunit (family B)
MEIDYQHEAKYPKRGDYIVSSPIDKTTPFMPNNWVESPFGEYTICCYGVLPDGRKASLTLTGVPIYIDVEMPDVPADKFRASLGVDGVISSEVVKLYSGYKFSPEPTPWLRLHFETIKDHKAAVRRLSAHRTSNNDAKYFWAVLRNYNIPTADWLMLSGYEKNGLQFTCPITAVRKVHKSERKQLGKVADADKTLVCSWDIETYSESGEIPRPERTGWTIDIICMSMFWQYSPVPLTEICIVCHDYTPDPSQPIPCVVRCHDQKSMAQAFITVLRTMQPDIMIAFNGACFDTPLMVRLIERSGLVEALGAALGRRSKAENIMKYNFKRDATIKINAERSEKAELLFDFPCMIDTDAMIVMAQAHPKAEVPRKAGLNFYLQVNKLGGKEDMDYKRLAAILSRSKIGACGGSCAVCTGCLPILDDREGDTCAERRARNRADVWEAMYYCKIDCLRPFQLYHKRGVINDRREMANLARVPLVTAFYQADGVKVQNLLGKYAHKTFNMAFSNNATKASDSEKDHNAGAYVPPPKIGLHRTVPIGGVDAASLYPSLIMDGNYSPDMLVKDKEEARRLAGLGYRLREIGPIHYTKGAKKDDPTNRQMVQTGWFVWHGGNDERITIGYEKNGVPMWPNAVGCAELGTADPIFVGTHDVPDPVYPARPEYTPIYGRNRLAGERAGLLPYVCQKLFEKRLPVKALWGKYVEIAKEMTQNGEAVRIVDGKELTLEEVSYLAAKTNSKQLAIKVLNNTIYGQSGNFRSPTYEFMVAAAITHSGQRVIKSVMEYTTELGGIVWYGDTDSEYISAPIRRYLPAYEEYAAKLRAAGLSGPDGGEPWEFCDGWAAVQLPRELLPLRIALWESMVKTSQTYIGEMCERIADLMYIQNGSRRLQFAFEEVGMPTILCGKKKYAMIPHERVINFYPPKVLVAAGNGIMVRGLDMVKQGVPEITKQLGTDILHTCLSPEFEGSLKDYVVARFRELLAQPISPDSVAKTARYKPAKKNAAVQLFVQRMRERQRTCDEGLRALFEPPESGDKFLYVIVKNAPFNLNGTKADDKIGGRMEYLEVFKRSQSWPEPYVLDKKYYIEKSLITLLSRFIAYHPDFAPKTSVADYDKAIIKAASTYLKDIMRDYLGETKGLGAAYRKVYKETTAALSGHLARCSPRLAVTFSPAAGFSEFVGALKGDILQGMMPVAASAQLILAAEIKKNGRQYCVHRYCADARRGTPTHLYKAVKAAEIRRVEGKLAAYADKYSAAIMDYSACLQRMALAKRVGQVVDDFPEEITGIYRDIEAIVSVLAGFEHQCQVRAEIARQLRGPQPEITGTATVQISEVW